jgi:hypothetical protein
MFLERGHIRRKIVLVFLERAHVRWKIGFGVPGTWPDSSENWFWRFWNVGRFVGKFVLMFLERGHIHSKIVLVFLERDHVRWKIGFGVPGTWPDSSENWSWRFWNVGRFRRKIGFGVSGTWPDASENMVLVFCFWNIAGFVGKNRFQCFWNVAIFV